MLRRAFLVVVTLASACSSSKSAERPPPEKQAAEYFPVHVGDAWVYVAESGPRHDELRYDVVDNPEPRVFVMQVKQLGDAPASAHAKIGNARMEVRPRGIFDGTRYILQDPVERGTKWTAVLDARTAEHFEVIADNVTADVPAGRFNDCVIVRLSLKEPGDVTQKSDATYCRGVGMVESFVTVEKPGRPTLTLGHLKLRLFEKKGQRIFPKRLGE